MELTDADEIRSALEENDDRPFGQARSARAEEIAAAAEAAGEPALHVAALQEFITAYEYGAEHVKMLVPFARLLKLLDDQPGAFSPDQLRSTQWYFKWATQRMMETPDTPLPTIAGWIREMERRYRTAGFSMRTIAAQDLELASHVGGTSQAEAARQAMLSLPRDRMSDCAACEANQLGSAQLIAGRDEEAIDAWSAVLSGRLRCREEPHRVLARSLLPLLRLGRADDATSNHLRGYRLARGNANLAPAIGLHLEFCALTGNEGRGVEILADNWHLLRATTDAMPRLEFLTGAAVLLQRLTTSGYENVPIHSETAGSLLSQIMPEITGLAARFDARNGTTWVGDRMNQRLRQPPLRDRLILDGGAALMPAASRRPAGDGSRDGTPADLDSLVERARDLSTTGHPGARDAWEEVRKLLAGADPDDRLAGDLASDQALRRAKQGDWAGAAAGLRTAAACYHAAGLPGRAAAEAARAEWAAAQQEPHEAAWPELDAQLATVQRLLAAGQAEPRDLLAVRHSRALVAAQAADLASGASRDELVARFTAETAELIADARAHGTPARAAAGEFLLAGLAGRDGDVDGEISHLQAAVDLIEQADRPWVTPRMKARLGELMLSKGDPAAAVPLLEAAIAGAGQWPEADVLPLGPAHVVLANAYRLQGRPDLAVPSARIGLSRLSRAGDALAAAQARADLGLALAAAGRLREAAAMLTDAIAQLGELEGEPAAARNRMALGRVLRRSGDHRGAAQQFALAAGVLSTGPDKDAYLASSAEAALSLADCEMWDEAHAAYENAITLATTLGQWPQLVNIQRDLAQLSVRDGRADGPGRALDHIHEALAAGERAYGVTSEGGAGSGEGGAAAEGDGAGAEGDGAGAEGDGAGAEGDGAPAGPALPAQNGRLARERGITCCAAGRALAHAERYEEALAWLDRGIADLAADDASIDQLAEATSLAAFLEGAKLGRAGQARKRLQAVIDRCTQLGREEAAAELMQLSAELEA